MRPRVLPLLLVLALLTAGCTLPIGDNGRVGSAGRELVDPALYPKLVVEIDHPAGHAPHAEAVRVLRETLVDVTARPAANIQIVQEASIPAEPSKKYTYEEIARLADQHRSRFTGGDTVVLHITYVAGGSANDDGDSRVLGAAYRGTNLVIFKGNIAESSKGGLLSTRPEERCIERAVLVHEFGHAAGLVNLGTPMVRDHEDPDHPGHSANKRSVMYWAVENSLDLLTLFGSCSDIPYQFDADDKADLAALRS